MTETTTQHPGQSGEPEHSHTPTGPQHLDAARQRTRDLLRAQVRARYAEAATEASACCSTDCCAPGSTASSLYGEREIDGLPVAAVQASLGCGNPLLVAELAEGERVLDLGSGGGIDVLLSARRVGPTGFAYGVDMTPQMLDLARRNAAEAGATNVEFREGTIEDLPLPDDAVDVVISNCVINLSVDKPAVLREAFRVLVPGGRLGVSDIVAEDHLSPAERAERGSYAGCIAGALSRSEYLEHMADAGFVDATVTVTHEVADGLHSAIIRATTPAADPACCTDDAVGACC